MAICQVRGKAFCLLCLVSWAICLYTSCVLFSPLLGASNTSSYLPIKKRISLSVSMVITIEAINFKPLKVNISKRMAVLTDLVLYALTARVNAGHSIPDKPEDS